MKNEMKSSHPYLQNNMSVGEPCAPYVSPVERVRHLSEGPVSEQMPEPPREYSLGTMSHGLFELNSQLENLRSDVGILRSRMRVFLPDHLFDSLQGCCGTQGYSAAGNLNSPVLQAIAEIANLAVSIRDQVNELSANIVN